MAGRRTKCRNLILLESLNAMNRRRLDWASSVMEENLITRIFLSAVLVLFLLLFHGLKCPVMAGSEDAFLDGFDEMAAKEREILKESEYLFFEGMAGDQAHHHLTFNSGCTDK